MAQRLEWLTFDHTIVIQPTCPSHAYPSGTCRLVLNLHGNSVGEREREGGGQRCWREIGRNCVREREREREKIGGKEGNKERTD